MADNNTENKTTKTEDILPYSYHTFMFPFLWNNGGKKIKREDFVKCLDKTFWYRENRLDGKTDDQSLMAEYKIYHYFNSAARNAVYGGEEDDSVVWNYYVDVKVMAENLLHKKTNTPAWLGNPKDKHNPAQYVIFRKYIKEDKEKGEEPVVERKSININGIRLKLFNTGIGILIFELENYTYQEPDDINWINEFGRRIYMPYLKNVDFCDGCAQEIYLEYEGKRIVEGWFNIKPKSPRDTKLAAPITYLLSNGDYTVTTDEKANNEKLFFIEPIVDDRMFVACYYINKDKASWLCERSGSQYCYLTDSYKVPIHNDANRSAFLYKFVFVDTSFLSCRSCILMREMLKKHIYDRWAEDKDDDDSLTGISEYSMVTITGSKWDVLAQNFLTEYVEMMILVLAQRASLLAFERMISDSTLGRADISEIQTKYIRFQSQLLLKEVTPQQQGIELYKMLLDNLFIAEQTAEVEKQIDSLATHKSSQSESRENLILFFIAVLGVFDTINYLADWTNIREFHWVRFAFALLAITGVCCVYFISKDKLKKVFKLKKSKKEKKSNKKAKKKK